MRHLLQPRVLNIASVAALGSALACYPRVSLWLERPGPLWYLEITIFVCCTILWGFVFAWHTPYTQRPVFPFKMEPKPLLAATLTGLGAAALFHFWLDPKLRSQFPEEFPPDLSHWLASVLFTLGLSQLFLVLAPFDWLIRLLKKQWLAMGLTALFAVGVQALKIHMLPAPLSPGLLAALLVIRFVGGCLAVAFYLRGGVLLVWWWTLLLEIRHLLDLGNSP
jgi:hypothetical protein